MGATIARRVGCTEGQVWTMATGLVVALLLAFAGAHLTGQSGPNAFARATPPVSHLAAPPSPPSAATAIASPPTVAFAGSATPIVTPQLNVVAEGRVPPSLFPVATPALFAAVGPPGAPFGLAVRSDGRVFVSTDNGTARGAVGPSQLFEFDQAGHQVGAVAIGGQPATHADGLGAAAVDPVDGSVYVVDIDSARIIRVNPSNGTQTVATAIRDLSPCVLSLGTSPCQPGVMNHAPQPAALAFDSKGDLYIADAGQATIWRWHPGLSAPDPWYQSTDLATGDGPAGLAFDARGNLLFTAGTTLDVNNPDAGGLYSLTIGPDGSPATRTLVAKFSNDEPGALAVDPSGTIYLILRATGTIDTVQGSTISGFATTGSPIPLDGPAGLALQNGRLLVTNESPSNESSHWVVLSFPLATRAA